MKTKVLIIGPYPPPYSGPELSTKQLLESQLRTIFHLDFLNTNVRKDNVGKGKIDHKALIAVLRFNIKIIFTFLFKKPDIAYHLVTPTEIGWLGRDIWFLWYCSLFNIKSVIHFRGSHLNINFTRFSPSTRFLIRKACKKVNAAIVQSECLRNQFDGLVPESRVHVIPNTVDDFYTELNKNVKRSRSQILFFGHLTKSKGYVDLLKVIPIVAKAYPDVLFLCCGNIRSGEPGVKYDQTSGKRIFYEDPFEAELKILNSKYSINYVNCGVVSGDEKLNLLQSSTAFVLPSYSEGFSRAILESLAVGLPVITTPVGANKDVIQNRINGVLVEPGDLVGLSNAIMEMIESESLRHRLSENGKTLFENNFKEEIIIAKYIKLFNSLK